MYTGNWVVSCRLTSRPLYPRGIAFDAHQTGDCVDPRAGSDAVAETNILSCRGSSPDSVSPQLSHTPGEGPHRLITWDICQILHFLIGKTLCNGQMVFDTRDSLVLNNPLPPRGLQRPYATHVQAEKQLLWRIYKRIQLLNSMMCRFQIVYLQTISSKEGWEVLRTVDCDMWWTRERLIRYWVT
jgi:hypothetical protein